MYIAGFRKNSQVSNVYGAVKIVTTSTIITPCSAQLRDYSVYLVYQTWLKNFTSPFASTVEGQARLTLPLSGRGLSSVGSLRFVREFLPPQLRTTSGG